ncbi:uncharacterized protein LOC116014195 [Ipomoea triloba]|uniref:uncharacterized protein LOC116014195 n=1 Tax=Ipomoea triloba TaxID=35885 RepID=UPI00125D8205|nr:uncharacterized protein LOC116014195 [Ipomoea triloba]
MGKDAEEMVGESEDSNFCNPTQGGLHAQEITLSAVLTCLISAVLFPGPDTPATFQHRVKVELSEYAPLLCEASQNTARNIHAWTRWGSPFRALLLLSVGTIGLFCLTGLLMFMIFFVAATVNAIVISLVISLVVAGGFLVLLFACLIAIYLGALFAAILVISTATISAIITASIAAGWIGFFFTVGLLTKKSIYLAKSSLSTTASAFSSRSSTQHTT